MVSLLCVSSVTIDFFTVVGLLVPEWYFNLSSQDRSWACVKLKCQHHSTRSTSALDDLLALESESMLLKVNTTFVQLTIEIWGEMELYCDKWTKLKKNKKNAKNNTKWVASIPSTYVKIWYAVGNRYLSSDCQFCF